MRNKLLTETILIAFALVCFFAVSCKKEGNKEINTLQKAKDLQKLN